MFYCGTCAKDQGWSETGFKSYGKCEVCTKTAECSDMPSYLLPNNQADLGEFNVLKDIIDNG